MINVPQDHGSNLQAAAAGMSREHRSNFQPPWMPGTGLSHRLFTALQVIQQRAVGIGKLPAVVLSGFEESRRSPAVEGSFADAEAIRSKSLNCPG